MSQPKFITRPSYDQLHNAAVTMVKEAKTFGWIDCIVYLQRGGMLFGSVAAYKLNVPAYGASYSSKHGHGDDKNHDNQLPTIPHKTILLVDDLADSGETLAEVHKHYTDAGHKVITAVFHYKESSVFHPDLYWWRIPKDSEWIEYPFED